jgi:general nucleoside transport system permease protein
VSTPASPPAPNAPQPPADAEPAGFAARLSLSQRAGGVVTPLLTVLVAFLVGGLVVLMVSGKSPLSTYRAIFDGTGLNWLLPWDTCHYPCQPAINLQQTLVQFTALVLTGLAVAFAFRCGLFNIGGQGQFIVGSITAVWIGTSLDSLPAFLHVTVAVVAAAIVGGLWAGIAGFLKATVGAHEVITTIMLNWVAIYLGLYLVGIGGPMQDPSAGPVGVSAAVDPGARLHVFWGTPGLQALNLGFFIAIGALVVYSLLLNRTTFGYEVRAVGFNPEAAAYGGISVRRSYFLAMAISGAFAGIAGAIDILGWQFRVDQTWVKPYSEVAFLGIAVALLGRNKAVGIFFSALLFAALKTGTSVRNLDPNVFPSELAGGLTEMIQGLVVLFVGAELLILGIWQAGKRRARASQRAAE